MLAAFMHALVVHTFLLEYDLLLNKKLNVITATNRTAIEA
jgi:hypothetical protein